MDLISIVTERKSSSRVREFFAHLVPNKIFTDTSYKYPDNSVKTDFGDYFDSCAQEIGQAVQEVFGEHTQTRNNESEDLEYRFTAGEYTITYEITSRDPVVYKSLGNKPIQKSFHLDVRGILRVESSTSIDMEKIGQFMIKVLQSHTLEYDITSREFLVGIPNHPRDRTSLLKEMGINPSTGAVYRNMNNEDKDKGLYERVQIEAH